MRNITVAFSILIATVFAVYQVPSSAADPPGTIDSKGKTGAQHPPGADHPFYILAGFVIAGGAQVPEAASCDPLPKTTLPVHRRVDNIIATVADPARTRLGLTFDRQMEAILKAAQKAGYQFQDSWLPWKIAEEQQSTNSLPLEIPGLLLFRRTVDKKEEALAVWLVGETPTSGISRDQFPKALCYGKQFDDSRLVGIAGTTYSGGLPSLHEELAKAGIGKSVLIRSGTTTAKSAIDAFAQNHDFKVLLPDDDVLQARLLPYLSSQHVWADLTGNSVVILAEGDTLFGNALRKSQDKPDRPDVITYPREISRLRNAYPDMLPSEAQKNGQAARYLLPQVLRDAESGRDTIPHYSPQTPGSLESVLFHISDRLRNSHFDTAILFGSNVLDTLFLSRFLRRNSPDLRIVISDSDLLFVSGSESVSHVGTLSASAFPLLSQLEPTKPLDVFASMIERGEYLAMLCVIEACSGGVRQPLWLSIAGRGAYWPVALLDGQRPETLEIPPASRTWNGVFWFSSLLCGIWITMCARVMRMSTLPTHLAQFHPQPDTVTSQRRYRALSGYHLGALLFTFWAFCALLFPPVRLAVEAAPLTISWLAQSIGGSVLVIAMLTICHRSIRHWPKEHWRNLGTAACLLALVLAALSFFMLFPIEEPPDAPGQGMGWMRALRSVQLPSGVAPNVPLLFLFLALAWWSWVNWRRSILATEREVRLPVLPDYPCAAANRIRRTLRQPLLLAGRPGLLAAGIPLVCAIVGARWFGSVESLIYTWTVCLLVAIVSAALLSTAWAFFAIWRDLDIFLQAMGGRKNDELKAVHCSIYWPTFWSSSGGARGFQLFRRTLTVLHSVPASTPKSAFFDLRLKRLKTALDESLRCTTEDRYSPASVVQQMGADANFLTYRLATDSAHVSKFRPVISELIGLRSISFIRYVLSQLHNQLSFLAVGFLLTAAAIQSYPFQGSGYLRWWTAVLLLVPCAAVGWVLWHMRKSRVLNKIKKKEGEDNSAYSWLTPQLTLSALLPLLAAVSTLFPSVGEFLFSWLHPTLSALK